MQDQEQRLGAKEAVCTSAICCLLQDENDLEEDAVQTYVLCIEQLQTNVAGCLRDVAE